MRGRGYNEGRQSFRRLVTSCRFRPGKPFYPSPLTHPSNHPSFLPSRPPLFRSSQIIEQVEEECAEIETKIGALNKQQAAIRHESGELKKKANDLKDRNATISIAIQEGQAEEKKLSSQIVQSPERVKREMSSATERLENEVRITDPKQTLDNSLR